MKWPHVRTPAHTLLLAAQRLITPARGQRYCSPATAPPSAGADPLGFFCPVGAAVVMALTPDARPI